MTWNDDLRSVLTGTAGLSIALLVALVLTVVRSPTADDRAGRDRLVAGFLVGIGVQGLHFAEELTTRFYERFPELLGLRPWSITFFVAFNLAWLGIWVASVAGLRADHRIAYFPIWFFAIAMIANGVAHPLLAVVAGGYFPGLLTSPLVGLVGLIVWRRLIELTRAA